MVRVDHAVNYRKLIDLADEHNATSISFQHHTFVNFVTRPDAEAFSVAVEALGLRPWSINTQRPYVPFEVIVNRW